MEKMTSKIITNFTTQSDFKNIPNIEKSTDPSNAAKFTTSSIN